MPRPKIVTFSPVAADPNGLAVAQTATGAVSLSMSGALTTAGVGTFDPPAHISITATGNNSGVVFTAVGTDRHGSAITSAITGPNATTVKDTKNYKTITSITSDGASTGAVNIGLADELETAWFPVSRSYSDELNIGFGVTPSVTATGVTWTMQHTFDDVQVKDFQENDATTFNHDSLATQTTQQDGNYAFPFRAMRLKLSGYGAGTVKLAIYQTGL